jgi:hypothetical protein
VASTRAMVAREVESASLTVLSRAFSCSIVLRGISDPLPRHRNAQWAASTKIMPAVDGLELPTDAA